MVENSMYRAVQPLIGLLDRESRPLAKKGAAAGRRAGRDTALLLVVHNTLPGPHREQLGMR